MKLAYVTPIFKKGDNKDSTNYRPISLTPSFAKIFERLLLTQMTDFIDKQNNNLDQSKETVAIFLDLAKAFDSILHKIFLKKN